MAILTIRNLPDEVHTKLRMRAAQAGRSMEAEVRAVLVAVTNGELIARETKREALTRVAEYRALVKRLSYVKTVGKFTRDEANERR
jgi:antitoxin FitA